MLSQKLTAKLCAARLELLVAELALLRERSHPVDVVEVRKLMVPVRRLWDSGVAGCAEVELQHWQCADLGMLAGLCTVSAAVARCFQIFAQVSDWGGGWGSFLRCARFPRKKMSVEKAF